MDNYGGRIILDVPFERAVALTFRRFTPGLRRCRHVDVRH